MSPYDNSENEQGLTLVRVMQPTNIYSMNALHDCVVLRASVANHYRNILRLHR